MNKYIANSPVRVPRHTILGMSERLLHRRIALVEPLAESESRSSPEDGIYLCRVTSGHVQFKANDSFWVDETNGQVVGRSGTLIESEEATERALRQEEIEELMNRAANDTDDTDKTPEPKKRQAKNKK